MHINVSFFVLILVHGRGCKSKTKANTIFILLKIVLLYRLKNSITIVGYV